MKIIITENLQKTQRYIPHTLETRLAAVKTYTNKNIYVIYLPPECFI